MDCHDFDKSKSRNDDYNDSISAESHNDKMASPSLRGDSQSFP